MKGFSCSSFHWFTPVSISCCQNQIVQQTTKPDPSIGLSWSKTTKPNAEDASSYVYAIRTRVPSVRLLTSKYIVIRWVHRCYCQFPYGHHFSKAKQSLRYCTGFILGFYLHSFGLLTIFLFKSVLMFLKQSWSVGISVHLRHHKWYQYLFQWTNEQKKTRIYAHDSSRKNI